MPSKQLLLNGDCLPLMHDMESESVDGVFTDPPYNINLQPQRKTHGEIANDALTPSEYRDLITVTFSEIYRLLKPDSVAWVCCNWQCADVMFREAKSNKFEVNNCIVWVKNNFGLGYHFRPQHEFIWVLFKGKPPVPLQAVSNVWNVARLIHTIHPTEKPLELVQKALRQYNRAGDVILDPFAGSFSTCMAAKQLGMGYIGIEKMKKYFDIGQERVDGCGYIAVENDKGTVEKRAEGIPLLELMNE